MTDPITPSSGGGVNPQGPADVGKDSPYKDESPEDFWRNVSNYNMDDPYAKQFWTSLQDTVTRQVNRDTQKAKEASKKLKESFEEK